MLYIPINRSLACSNKKETALYFNFHRMFFLFVNIYYRNIYCRVLKFLLVCIAENVYVIGQTKALVHDAPRYTCSPD
jgi:hypothetical protein